jgi:hypothetical protein
MQHICFDSDPDALLTASTTDNNNTAAFITTCFSNVMAQSKLVLPAPINNADTISDLLYMIFQ